jgi:hypothetical protein
MDTGCTREGKTIELGSGYSLEFSTNVKNKSSFHFPYVLFICIMIYHSGSFHYLCDIIYRALYWAYVCQPPKCIIWLWSSLNEQNICHTVRCKLSNRVFDCHGVKYIFMKLLTCMKYATSRRVILPAALGPGVYSASNRNEYQKQKNNVSGK